MAEQLLVCLQKPTANGLQHEFSQFGDSGSDARFPCRRGCHGNDNSHRTIKNQCAVRMSVALCRSMNNNIFAAYHHVDRGGYLHSSRCCAGERKFPHLTGAQDLYNYLISICLFEFSACPTKSSSDVLGKKGIIFFRHCFHRQGDSDGSRRGSHIDYWNGTTYTNSARGNNNPGNLHLFNFAEEVSFCQLF